jgi:Bacterial regulatory proteins, gntR family
VTARVGALDWPRNPVGQVGLVSGESLPGRPRGEWARPASPIGRQADAQWLKAAGGLADGIRTGRYAPGERLPTVTDMALAACVHPKVMARALRRLRELGYVHYRSGHGYYVADDPPPGGI